MTAEQHPLFPDPHFTDGWAVGDRARNRFTGNRGTVVLVVPGRHVVIAWEQWAPHREGRPWSCRHSSDLGLQREDVA